jgi:hypothetical protein
MSGQSSSFRKQCPNRGFQLRRPKALLRRFWGFQRLFPLRLILFGRRGDMSGIEVPLALWSGN